jgi:hypothetical protein
VNADEAVALVVAVTSAWLEDPENAVEWAGEHEGRHGLRMSQEVREATTVWFSIGDHTVGYEAYLLPRPPYRAEEVYRLCLARNHRSWPAAISMDDRGDLFVGGRIPLTDLSHLRLEEAVGAVYQTIEISFRPIVEMGFRPPDESR